MIKTITTLFIILSVFNIKAQENLVPNGNFEDTIICSNDPLNSYGSLKEWFVPQKTEVNVAQNCLNIDWFRFIRDKKVGRNNSRSGFIETYYRGFADDQIYSGRRYLAVKLTQPLTAGQQYYFEMYVRALDTFPNFKLVNTVFTDGQDVAFTKDYPKFDFDVPRNFLQIKPTFRSKLYNDYEWHKVSGCFSADGGEQYVIFGNFKNDANTEAVSTGKVNKNFTSGQNADYAIDDVILTPMTVALKDTAICVGDTFKLNVFRAIPDSVKYKWHNGSTTPQYFSIKPDNLHVVVQYPAGCEVSAWGKLAVIAPSYKPIAKDSLICQGETARFKAGVHIKGESIRWQNGSTERFLTVNTEGVSVATITSPCANWTDTFRLKLKNCGEGLFVPNIFSPNSDGQNDEFKPFFKPDFLTPDAYSFKIFNRWGNLVFETNDKNAAWNGNYKGNSLPPDLYIWTIIITHSNRGKTETLKYSGDIFLIK